MFPTLLALLSGGAILVVSLNRERFERMFGPTLRAQNEFQQRFPTIGRKPSDATYINIMRTCLVGAGFLIVIIGLLSLVVVIRH